MDSLEEFEMQLNELLASVEKAMDCIEDCNHKVSDIHEKFTGITTDKILLPIDERHTFFEHSHEELVQFHGFLAELVCFIEAMSMPELYGLPSSFEGDETWNGYL